MVVKDYENAVTIKYNEERKFFEAYMPNGDKVPFARKITISDNFDNSSGPITATIELFVNIE